MKIAVINETSAGDKNKDIIAALESYEHEVFNIGMKQKGGDPELQYNHTGLLAALALNTKKADFVIGSCGTGQGFITAAMQYPSVICGHILTPLDAWLFAQINGGNAIALALNQGYGWASDVNIRFIFDRLFSTDFGCGYPAERKEPQKKSRELLSAISRISHKSMAEIVASLPRDFVQAAIGFPGVLDFLDVGTLSDRELATAIEKAMKGVG